MLHSCNVGVILVCRYTRNMYSCMNDWLTSINCTSRVAVATVMEAIDRLVGPFASNYNCSVVPGTTTDLY